MAQANEKPARRKNRYYWIRLKENFFEDDRIRIIASVPDGNSILIFYLKLMLKSIQGEGELFKDSGIDCTPQILGAVTGTDPNIVLRALELLQSLHMIETEQERLFIPQTMQLLGSEDESAERVRRCRSQAKQKSIPEQNTPPPLQCNADVTQTSLQCNIENRDKSIEIRDKSLYNNISCSNSEQNDCHLSGKTEQDESLVVQKADDRKAKSPCPSMTPEQEDPMFDQFWEADPRKVGKRNAQKAFERLQVDKPLLDKMLRQIAHAKQSRQWQDVQYIPHPATWLNGRRWEDELPTEDELSGKNTFPAKEVSQYADTGTADPAAAASPWRRGLIG